MRYNLRQLSKFKSSRDEVIVDLCRGKRVLHVGATDAPYTQGKLEAGLLLHQKIGRVADDVLGIDVDEGAIELLKRNGIGNILAFDMNQLGGLDYDPDVIILGETIEHLMNLELALTNLKQVMGDRTLLVVSTPNALWLTKVLHAFLHVEHQHPDHKVIFSLATLKHLFEFNDLHVREIYYTFLNRRRSGVSKWLKKGFCRVFVGFSETLLFVVEKNAA
jgi:2-polyprenyl-3-methyl-5-hydroxy-6-metoxy-1,4-benzoquinol methylase